MRRSLAVLALCLGLAAPAGSARAASAIDHLTAEQIWGALAVGEASFAFGTFAGWWIGSGVAGGCGGQFEGSCDLSFLAGGAIGAAVGGLLLPPLLLEVWGDANDHDGSGLVALYGVITGIAITGALTMASPEAARPAVAGTSLFILPGLLAGGGYLTTGPVGPHPPGGGKAVWSW